MINTSYCLGYKRTGHETGFEITSSMGLCPVCDDQLELELAYSQRAWAENKIAEIAARGLVPLEEKK